MTVTTSVEIDKQTLESLIVSAFESGYSSWMDSRIHSIPKDFRWNPNNYANQFLDGEWYAEIYDSEDSEEHLGKLDIQSLEKGLQLMSDKYPKTFADILADNDDAYTADILMQLSIMGKLIYG